MRALRASMVRHVLTKIQPTNVNVLMDILVTDVILEVSFFSISFNGSLLIFTVNQLVFVLQDNPVVVSENKSLYSPSSIQISIDVDVL